ncbi:atrial natriuretic peptide receptor 1-like [Mercenaria mercenaria]|uniref:atrial natriuretic peptide receptor 1-like n=1 Tax=Mercenaria mercenaria TaxID=6596 RepID=UPI00234EA1CE|nr:atrial natriuretic peptide receptor 1-like [Mercenaria mercenaria]
MTERACCVNITIGVLAERSAVLDFPFSINRTKGLIDIAINKTRHMLKDAAHLEYVIMPCDVPTCVATKWGALFSEMYHKYRPHAVIGPGCTPSVQTVSRMAASWNIPHITYVGTDESLGDKHEFSMLSRLSFTMNLFATFYIEVFNAFEWTYIANIYDSNTYLPNLVGTSLQRSFAEEAPHIKSYPVPFNGHSENLAAELSKAINRAATKARVFVVSCLGDVLRRMVLQARNSVLAGEEYEARLAYQSVMVIRPRRPTTQEFFEFEQDVKDRALTEYNYTWREDHEVNIYNIGHYDSFILYAHALNETLSAGEDPRDGAKVVKRMWNRTFPGIGGPVFVNENGDRDTDFTLLDLDPDTGEFQIVAQYLGWTRKFEFIPNVSIHWPQSGTAPPNIPACGFTGELCVTFRTEIITLNPHDIVRQSHSSKATGMLRRQKAEAEIHSNWWRITLEDIAMQTHSSFFSSRRKYESDERSSVSLATHAVCFQTVGVYRGTQVHIRKPKIRSISVDRKLLLELKQMHQITSPNLTRLIGICPEVDNVCILTEHCSRGSLQDILHNESFQLDWDFRISLINDIVEGMHYLHTSPIQTHGRLTSSKCVIDSRFVLKITEFGLDSINNTTSNRSVEQNAYTSSLPELLWMAPEHLRIYPPRRSSQPGDVYSFAIILYEMCTRNEPYVNESWYMSLDDTLEKIKRGGTRPTLDESESLPDVVRLTKCSWLEMPEDRPSFSNIRRVIKTVKMKRNMNPAENVLDVLLNRMEQYANNLEGLVEDRTQAFLDEKKKSEDLLYQVLPKSVADQLRIGNAVSPESYSSVTIYFSDIVGFTEISAKSSPFQIVDFLNDLYTCFDSIIENYNVYKVETIGDAYMVVSGLPERNGNEHVRQIARMSFDILHNVRQFTIRHQPETRLKARIGIHTGPVCAGVVGRKMPRYCLFGDTVNTASRMESNGEAMKIHISEQTKQLLELGKNFITEERGVIDIKGKGLTKTFWLIDEISSNLETIML